MLKQINFDMSKKEKEMNRLMDEFDMIQEDSKSSTDFDISNHLATLEDLPDLGEIELYDYDSDLISAHGKGLDVLESLVDLYFADFPDLKKHPYIRNKLREDAMVYAETVFLQKMTRKNFIIQMRQVDNGDNSARMHEVVNQTIKEIRETSKFASSQKSELEKYYKEFRNDLSDVAASISKNSSEDDEDGQIVDSNKLNDMINQAILKDKKHGDNTK